MDKGVVLEVGHGDTGVVVSVARLDLAEAGVGGVRVDGL